LSAKVRVFVDALVAHLASFTHLLHSHIGTALWHVRTGL
jgi:hypothetical protein